MKNEYGARLDRNGYAPSIIQIGRFDLFGDEQDPDRCYLCGRRQGYGYLERLERHEPWGGNPNRQRSKELGLWVCLCGECHQVVVHGRNAEERRELQKDAQRAAMLRYGWSREEWIRRFGRSEMDEQEAARVLRDGADVREAVRSVGRGRGGDAAEERRQAGRQAGFRVIEGEEMPF